MTLLACDWGTTNLRAWVLGEDGAVLREGAFDFGVAKLAPGEAGRRFVETVRPALQAEALPALLCGMIGSTLGWVEAPYVACPATLEDLAHGVISADARSRIVPGLRCPGPAGAPDVMRGEETQILGWAAEARDRARGRRLICHPGTHPKWAVVEDGRLTRFVTAMTGELFSILSRHGVLRSEPSDDAEAFDAGVEAAGEGDALGSRLFSARSRVVAGGADPAGTGAYLSGLLIGAEVASAPRLLGCAGEPVVLIGAPELLPRWRRALERRGVEVLSEHDGEAAARSGLLALHRLGDRR